MKDQISALVDDEITLKDAEYLYTALKADGESRECWMTYHMIGDVMRGSPIFKADMRERIMAQLDAAPTVLSPVKPAPATDTGHSEVAKKSPALWSVAASVAAVMFVGMIVLQQQPQTTEEIVPMEIAQHLPSEYLLAHQSLAPSSAAYYIQSASFSESSR